MNHLINEQFQAAKFAWTDNETFVTSSWTKAKAKMLKLWDIRKIKDDLSSEGEVTSVKIDTSTTVTTPYVDKESKLIYAIAKGESMIRTYDYSQSTFVKGIDFTGAEPSISTVMFDRKCLDYNRLEVDRFARYVNSQKVYYISYTIPRRNPGYDPTLYPPVECGEAALTYDQWVGGETSEPVKKDINTIDNKFVSKVEAFVKQEIKQEVKTPEMKIKELEGKIAEMSVKINQLTEENAKLKKQIEAKKAQPQEEPQQMEIQQVEEKHEEQPQEEQPPEEQPQEEPQQMEIQQEMIIQQVEENHEEQPAEEQPVEEQPAEEQPAEEQPAEEQPAEEQQIQLEENNEKNNE